MIRSIAASPASSTATARRCACGRRWRLESAAGVSRSDGHRARGRAPQRRTRRLRGARARALRDEETQPRVQGGAGRDPGRQRLHDPHAGRGGLRRLRPSDSGASIFPTDRGYLAALGITFEELLALGRAPGAGPEEPFRPSYLAMHGATRVNAVSALHAETSREVFRSFFPHWPKEEIPIRHVTNGVHVPSWDSPATDELWTNACGAEPLARRRPKGWTRRSPPSTIGRSGPCGPARARSSSIAREQRLERQLARRGASPEADRRRHARARSRCSHARVRAPFRRVQATEPPAAKRGRRCARLLGDRLRPVQLSIAGKAHPADGRQGAGRGLDALRGRCRGAHALRLPGGLRPLPRAGARSGGRRLDEYAPAPLGGLRHQRHEGAGQRRTQPVGARRLVGGGLRAGRRLGDRRSAAPQATTRATPRRSFAS